jgi:hypothetical protein
MEFFYTPDFLGNSNVENNIYDTSGSFETTSEDLTQFKAALRTCMPSAKPTHRLEYAARAFGYRTAASMQNALKAAKVDAPLVMTPLVGPLDADREQALLQATKSPTEAARDAAIAISRAVIKSRGKIELPWDVCGVREQRHVVNPLSRDREFSFLPDLAPPDLRTIFHATMRSVISHTSDCRWGNIPDGWRIEYLTESNTTDKQLAQMRPALVGANLAPERLPVVRCPVIDADRIQATMILKDDKQDLVGFVTFSFTIDPASEEEADWLNRRAYAVDLDAEALDYLRPKTRCDAWKGHLHLEASGDRYQGKVSSWSNEKFGEWVKDDDRIKAAFFSLMEHELGSIGYNLSQVDENEDDTSFGHFILDLTRDGYHIGETNYDEFAEGLHRILKKTQEFWNDSREGPTDRDIQMALCPSVYDYAYEALLEVGIQSPWSEDDDEEEAEED